MKKISDFRGPYRYLSNFYDSPVMYKGLIFRNSEAAFQGAKCERRLEEFVDLPPNMAKKLGRSVELRKDWDEVKDGIMYEIVRDKFNRNKHLGKMLMETGDLYLEEGNTWNDTYWGVCRGRGQNKLGYILMKVREELRRESGE